MRNKIARLFAPLGAVMLLSAPSVTYAQAITNSYVVCGNGTCTIYVCNQYGCSAVGTYPAPREIDTDG